jgi:hypothetical protein
MTTPSTQSKGYPLLNVGECWGIFLSSEGNGKAQLKKCLSRVKEFFGKFKNSSINNKAKWVAVTTVIEPAILYPL